jgi:hypothetical protein
MKSGGMSAFPTPSFSTASLIGNLGNAANLKIRQSVEAARGWEGGHAPALVFETIDKLKFIGHQNKQKREPRLWE